MRFRTTLELHGVSATGIEVPDRVVEELGGGKRPAVKVTINDRHTWRNTIGSRGGTYLLSVSAENRALADVEAGDEIEVEIELDTEPRSVEVPDDLKHALSAEPDAKQFFDSLTASQKSGFVKPIFEAKQTGTRQRRLTKTLDAVREGRKRP